MKRLHPVCGEQITLTAAEITYLQSLPEPAHVVDAELQCELQASHAGSHLALGQSYNREREVWVQWHPLDQREMVELADESDNCPAEGPEPEDPGDPWMCELPAGHPGAHSFEVEDGGSGRIPTPEMEARLDEILQQEGGQATIFG
jgi:hypothetical protein